MKEIILITTITIIILLFLYIILIYNGLVRLRNNINKAWANIDVLLKKRHNELPNLVNTVKGYMQHEKQTMQDITKARTDYLNSNNLNDLANANNELSSALKSLFAVSENYPDLKASDNFLNLQNRITELEHKISDRREYYNDSVNNYNIRIQSIPDILIAKLFDFNKYTLFQTKEEERQNVKISTYLGG
jgi:LemA protein